jgi:hypothetical protein
VFCFGGSRGQKAGKKKRLPRAKSGQTKGLVRTTHTILNFIATTTAPPQPSTIESTPSPSAAVSDVCRCPPPPVFSTPVLSPHCQVSFLLFYSPLEDYFAAMTEKAPNLLSDFRESE